MKKGERIKEFCCLHKLFTYSMHDVYYHVCMFVLKSMFGCIKYSLLLSLFITLRYLFRDIKVQKIEEEMDRKF